MNINENEILDENGDMQNYDNYQYRENLEGMVDIRDGNNDNDQIQNENEEQIDNYQDENNSNINNIQNNIEIFEDVNAHIEEIQENQSHNQSHNQNQNY